MGAAEKHDMNHLEQKYEEIMGLYDIADALAATVESKLVSDPEAQLRLVEPLIEQVGSAADDLTEEFINLAEGKKKRSTQIRVEAALRKMYIAVDEYMMQVHGASHVAVKKIKNIADAVVAKLKEKLEQIVLVFLDFVKLSLDRVMHNKELEELKRRHTEVAFQLHQMSQQP